MTKYGQTYNYTAGDHVNVIEKYIGKTLNYVILNNGKIPESALTIYEKGHEVPVVDNLKDSGRLKIIRADLVSKQFTNLSKKRYTSTKSYPA